MKDRSITFKADDTLGNLLDHLPNKSEYIRRTLRKALEKACPLCDGSGRLSDDQLAHWRLFNDSHHLQQCRHCRQQMLVCDHEQAGAKFNA